MEGGGRRGRSGKGITKAANLNAFYIALFMQAPSFSLSLSRSSPSLPPLLVSTSKKGAHDDDANKRERAAAQDDRQTECSMPPPPPPLLCQI